MRRANKILTSAKTAALAAAVTLLCAGPVLASDYAPFPNVSPGTVYRWKTYQVEDGRQGKELGILTNTIQGKTLVGDHEYIVVKRTNTEKKPLPPIVYRADDQLYGILLGPTEDSLLVHWKGTPSVGQSWSRGNIQVIIRGYQDVEAEGVSYQDCLVIDQLRDEKMFSRSYFDRSAGWVKNVHYQGGKPCLVGYRLPEGEQ